MASQPVILITGGNSGLGYETVKALCKSDTPSIIVLGARSIKKAEDAIKQLQSEVPDSKSHLSPIQIDITDDTSIQQAVASFSAQHDHLDVLINNAGASFDSQIDATDLSSIRRGWNNCWDVNVAGTHVATYAFAPLLLKAASRPPRLIFVTSGASSLESTTDMTGPFASRMNAAPPAGWPKGGAFRAAAYRSSKTGMNMMMREWEKTLREDGVKVLCVSPGLLATNLGGVGPDALRKMGAYEPHVGGEFVAGVAQGLRDGEAGLVSRYFGGSDVQPW